MAALAEGSLLGPYEILAPIGAGGMGTVYKARDTRLDRIVAVKVAQAEFSERFAREARAIAALNHPNICQLYDVGPNYLVMEHVEGVPLAAPETMRKLLDLAVQVADGMAAAHAAGFVHRDLKPDNILVTGEGRVKILDFGLAKAIAQEKPQDATVTIALTDPGTTIGTVAYMSPEQARGEQNLGAQSDQFAFGLILYEMAAGKRAFIRASRAETMTAIIREDAEPLPATTPAPLKWVILRLLAKDAHDRYDSSRDLYRELRHVRERLSEVSAVSQAEPASSAARPKRNALAWALLAAGLAVGAAAAALLIPKPSAVGDLSNYKFTPISRDEATERSPEWSPDGKSIAYAEGVNGLLQVFTRVVGSSEAAQITKGEKAAVNPFWSPDGLTIYFAMDNGLWAIGASGGTPELVFDRAAEADVHPDGKTFVFQRAGQRWISERGGEAKQLPLPQDLENQTGTRVMIGFSPDGSKIAGIVGDDLWILEYPSGETRKYSAQTRYGSWMPDSRRLVLSLIRDSTQGQLAVFDTGDGSSRVIHTSTGSILTPSVSPDGKRIAYVEGNTEWDVVEVTIPDGSVRTVRAGGGVSWYPAWAPAGTHYLVATDVSGKWTIEDISAAEGFSKRVAEVDAAASLTNIRWAPDGARFIFGWANAGSFKTMLSNATGGRMSPLDPSAPGVTTGAIWSPDGQWILYGRPLPAEREMQIARIRPGSTGSPEILATFKAGEPERARQPVAWSSAGILAVAQSGLYLMSEDYKSERKLSSRTFRPEALTFASDGRSALTIYRNTTGKGPEWQLLSIDIATGAEKVLTGIALPVTADDVRGLSLHPDGKRFLTSIALWPFDIWMLEGFE